ncbi:MAG: endonuclease III [Bacteroidales bacterium]|nr:endonuclease III [Bacteroidales bacterium]
MASQRRFNEILSWFERENPVPKPELKFENPFQLLVAVMLSAQCTDKRVNQTTPALFQRFPTAAALAAASTDEVFALIKSVSYPNSKTEHLISAAKMIVTEFGGEVPSDIDSLQRLPGVGRKTANVVTSVLYDNPVIAVDTHVFRVARRLGLSKGTTPLAVEKDLTKGIPEAKRPNAHHWLILHGRYVCKAQKPFCGQCGLSPLCAHYKKMAPAKPGSKPIED